MDKGRSAIEARLSLRQWDCFGILNFWRKSCEFYLIPNGRLWLVAKMRAGMAEGVVVRVVMAEGVVVRVAMHQATIKAVIPAKMMLWEVLE